jgi:protein-disulfide isomerase
MKVGSQTASWSAPIRAAALIAVLSAVLGTRSAAQTPAPATTASQKNPVQKQIEELREGQAEIRQELAAIRRLLEESRVRAGAPARSDATAAGAEGSGLKNILVDVEGEGFRGDRSARMAIVEYSDFDCSYCGKYVREVYPELDKAYIQPGKVKYFFRDLPGPGETNAVAKARAARCAGEQGKFWEMHDRLFASQADPALPSPESHAKALGLDLGRFHACLAGDRYSESIRLSIDGAKKAGIYGTPAFLLGTMSEDGKLLTVSKLLVGGESFEPIKTALDELLSAKTEK